MTLKKKEFASNAFGAHPRGDGMKRIEIPYATLSTYLQVLKSCNSEARVHVAMNKISTLEVDTANVFLANIEAKCKTTGHPFVFGLDVGMLQRVIKLAKGCNVIIDVGEKKIVVKYGRFQSKIDAPIEMHIRKDPNSPTIKLPTSFEAPGKYLHEALTIASSAERCQFTTKNGVVSFCVFGSGLCVKEIIGETKNKESVKSIFSSDYMKDIVNTVKDTSLKIDIGIDHPMRAYAEKNDCKITFLLAPRIGADR